MRLQGSLCKNSLVRMDLPISIQRRARLNRDSVLKLLREHEAQFRVRFNTRHLALFGSAARDELRPDSDIDILVEFIGPSTFDGYFSLKDYPEDLHRRRVDLGTEKGLKPRARRQVEKDLIRVA